MIAPMHALRSTGRLRVPFSHTAQSFRIRLSYRSFKAQTTPRSRIAEQFGAIDDVLVPWRRIHRPELVKPIAVPSGGQLEWPAWHLSGEWWGLT